MHTSESSSSCDDQQEVKVITRKGSLKLREAPSIVRIQRRFNKWLAYSSLPAAGSRVQVAILKCVPWFSILVILRRLVRVLPVFRRSQRSLSSFVLRVGFETWAFLEVVFWFYFRWKKRQLEQRRAYVSSILWKGPGERLSSLRRVLANVGHIHLGNAHIAKDAKKQDSKRSLVRANSGGRRGSDAPRAFASRPSVENFLRYESESSLLEKDYDNARSSLTKSRKRQSKAPGKVLQPQPSIERLLRSWSSERLTDTGGRIEESKSVQHSALQCLKHLELCTWFSIRSMNSRKICRDISEIKRGNIEQWVLSYWHDGAESIESEGMSQEEAREVHELVDEVIDWAELPLSKSHALQDSEKNPNLICYRLRNDPLPAVHRPLFVYGFTAFLFPTLGNRVLSWLGFRPYRSGSTEYWFRPPPSMSLLESGRPRKLDASLEPVVFIHGVGIGPSMCLTFLQRLVQNLGHSPIFVVNIGAISMRFVDDAPSSTEITSNIANMLQVWGCDHAHIIGHSFGTLVLAWMVRYKRSFVERATFIDPVCFLTLWTLKECFDLQQVRFDWQMNTMELVIKYFVLTELNVCNFVCRCFFWEESQLDMRDLEGMPALVVLEADDYIVQTQSVRRLVLAEQQRRSQKASTLFEASSLELMWVEEQPHAGFLGDTAANRELNTKIKDFHSLGKEMNALRRHP